MTTKTGVVSAALLFALVGGAAGSSPAADRGRGRRLRADLHGFNEVATVSSVARGSFHALLSADGMSIEYRLRFQDLEGEVTQSHIHFGDHHTAGGISVWLCGTAALPGPAGTPDCGGPMSGDVMGTITAAQVVGPAGQGIAAGEFEELVRAIKTGVTYANVHSTKFPGGEIRGQIRGY
jgi:hypothetical protein